MTPTRMTLAVSAAVLPRDIASAGLASSCWSSGVHLLKHISSFAATTKGDVITRRSLSVIEGFLNQAAVHAVKMSLLGPKGGQVVD